MRDERTITIAGHRWTVRRLAGRIFVNGEAFDCFVSMDHRHIDYAVTADRYLTERNLEAAINEAWEQELQTSPPLASHT